MQFAYVHSSLKEYILNCGSRSVLTVRSLLSQLSPGPAGADSLQPPAARRQPENGALAHDPHLAKGVAAAPA
jgi:hypothetical protein